jgi:uncharacterized membrane protein
MSSRTLRVVMIVLSTIGLGVASYLTYVHYTGSPILCLKGGGCETVQHSAYSKLIGIPVALIGLLGYIGILTTLLAPDSETTRLGSVTFVLVGFGFSMYLTGRELFSIHAICPWCVSSATIMTLLAILSVWRFLLGEQNTATRGSYTTDPMATEPDGASVLGAPGA